MVAEEELDESLYQKQVILCKTMQKIERRASNIEKSAVTIAFCMPCIADNGDLIANFLKLVEQYNLERKVTPTID